MKEQPGLLADVIHESGLVLGFLFETSLRYHAVAWQISRENVVLGPQYPPESVNQVALLKIEVMQLINEGLMEARESFQDFICQILPDNLNHANFEILPREFDNIFLEEEARDAPLHG